LSVVFLYFFILLLELDSDSSFFCALFFLCACFRSLIYFLFCALDCLGRRLGPRLLGRVDDSGVNNFIIIIIIFNNVLVENKYLNSCGDDGINGAAETG
jgi:hypothetical protein